METCLDFRPDFQYVNSVAVLGMVACKANCCSSCTHACASTRASSRSSPSTRAESFAVLYPFLRASVALLPSCNFVRRPVKDEHGVGLAEPLIPGPERPRCLPLRREIIGSVMAIFNHRVCIGHRLLMRRFHLNKLGCRVLTDPRHVRTYVFINDR